jgi:hypothetical protein
VAKEKIKTEIQCTGAGWRLEDTLIRVRKGKSKRPCLSNKITKSRIFVISLPGCRSQNAGSNFVDEKSIEVRHKVTTLALNSNGRRRTSHAEKPGAIDLGNELYVMMTTQNTIGKSKDMVHWMDPDVDNWPSFAERNGMWQCQASDRRRTGGKSKIMNRHDQ